VTSLTLEECAGKITRSAKTFNALSNFCFCLKTKN